MTKVIGLGCFSTAVTGDFIALIDDVYQAICSAIALLGICGEVAERQGKGQGTPQFKILGKPYHITEQEFTGTLKLSENE